MSGRPFDRFRGEREIDDGTKTKRPRQLAFHPYVHMQYGTACGFSAAVDIHSNVGRKKLADAPLHFSTSLSNLWRVAGYGVGTGMQ